jgi:spermidine synthase
MSAGAVYRLRFLFVVVVPAAVLMALEIVSSRLLAPQFGNSVYVWGSIIGIFLAAMSTGYVAGGRLADRRPKLPALGHLLLLSALLQWATALGGRYGVAIVGEATQGRPAGTLLAATLLFGPATLLLATVSPFAVRLAVRAPSGLGGVAGNLFALSTAGSLAGTLAATFVLIPALSLDTILALLVAATGLAAAASYGRSRFAAVALAVAIGTWWTPSLRPAGDGIVVERATPYQTLVVRESEGVRYLYSDGTLHGATDLASGETRLEYARSSPTLTLYSPHPKRVLLLGVGTGGVGRYLLARLPSIEEAVYVDIDPAVVEIARRQFGFEPGPRERIVVEDGRRFLAADPGGWDWIYVDTYVGLSVPFHLATREFFELARSKLAPGGVVGINVAGSVRNAFPRAILRTMGQVFGRIDAFGVPASGNHLLIGQGGPARPLSQLLERAGELEPRLSAPAGLRRLAGARLSYDLDLTRVPILTDQYAPVDALLDLSIREIDFDLPVHPER